MKVSFGDATLEELDRDPACRTNLDRKLVKAFRARLIFLRSADDERDIREWKALHMEKLSGDRAGQWSIRVKDQWRLIFEIHSESPKNRIHVVGLEDYHKPRGR